MKGHKVIKVILSLLTIIFMLGFGNNKLTFSQGSLRDVTDGTKIKITNLKITRTNEDT